MQWSAIWVAGCMMWVVLVSLEIFQRGYQSGGNLTVEIRGLRNQEGRVLISLFNSKEGFPGSASKALIKQTAVIKNSKAVALIGSLPPGVYAIAVLHDENDNLKMDFNAIGMPKEGYGFSQDATGLFGPPKFTKASFQHSGDQHITIRIRY